MVALIDAPELSTAVTPGSANPLQLNTVVGFAPESVIIGVEVGVVVAGMRGEE